MAIEIVRPVLGVRRSTGIDLHLTATCRTPVIRVHTHPVVLNKLTASGIHYLPVLRLGAVTRKQVDLVVVGIRVLVVIHTLSRNAGGNFFDRGGMAKEFKVLPNGTESNHEYEQPDCKRSLLE